MLLLAALCSVVSGFILSSDLSLSVNPGFFVSNDWMGEFFLPPTASSGEVSLSLGSAGHHISLTFYVNRHSSPRCSWSEQMHTSGISCDFVGSRSNFVQFKFTETELGGDTQVSWSLSPSSSSGSMTIPLRAILATRGEVYPQNNDHIRMRIHPNDYPYTPPRHNSSYSSSTRIDGTHWTRVLAHGLGMSLLFGLMYPAMVVLTFRLRITTFKGAATNAVVWGVFGVLLGAFWAVVPSGEVDGEGYAWYDESSVSGTLAANHKTVGRVFGALALGTSVFAAFVGWWQVEVGASYVQKYVGKLVNQIALVTLLVVAPLVCFTGWKRRNSEVSYAIIAAHLVPVVLAAAGWFGYKKYAYGHVIDQWYAKHLGEGGHVKGCDIETPEIARSVVHQPVVAAAAVARGAMMVGHVVSVTQETPHVKRVVIRIPGLRAAGQTVTIGTRKMVCVDVAAEMGVFVIASDEAEGVAEFQAGADIQVDRVSREVLSLPSQVVAGTLVAEGLGVVPALSMLKNKPSNATIWMFWVVRNQAELFLVDELTKIMNATVDITVVFAEGDAATLARDMPFRCLVGDVAENHIVDNILDFSSSLLVFGSQGFVEKFSSFASRERKFPENKIFTLLY